MISFALLSQQNMDKLIDFSERTDESVVVRFDPAVRVCSHKQRYAIIREWN